MPYLSHNYRFEPKSRVKVFMELTLLVFSSVAAIMFVLMALGLVSAIAAEAFGG